MTEMVKCESSFVQEYGYDRMTATLDIRISGKMYRFWDVPEDLFKKFEAAESKGKFFVAHIKNRFKEEKIDAAAG